MNLEKNISLSCIELDFSGVFFRLKKIVRGLWIYRVVQKVFVKMASRLDERHVNFSQKLSHNAQLVHVMTNHTNESNKNTKINCNNLT